MLGLDDKTRGLEYKGVVIETTKGKKSKLMTVFLFFK